MSIAVERKGADYLVNASGPFGVEEHQIGPEVEIPPENSSITAADNREQGRQLYDALIAESVRSRFSTSRSAEKEGKLIRLLFAFRDLAGGAIEYLTIRPPG